MTDDIAPFSSIEEAEAMMMAIPAIRAEVEKLSPTIRRLSTEAFVGLSIAMRREGERRTQEGIVARPVGIGNR